MKQLLGVCLKMKIRIYHIVTCNISKEKIMRQDIGTTNSSIAGRIKIGAPE